MMYGWACSTLSGRSDHTRGWDTVGFAFESSLICGYDGMYMGGRERRDREVGRKEVEEGKMGRM